MSGRPYLYPMSAEDVAAVIKLLRDVGRSDLLSEDVRSEQHSRVRPMRRAAEDVGAAVWACSTPRAKLKKDGEEGLRMAASVNVIKQHVPARGVKSPGGTALGFHPSTTILARPNAAEGVDTPLEGWSGPRGPGPH